VKNCCVRLFVTAGLAAAGAQAGPITVSALTDIWLAGQPNGSTLTGNFSTDTAPANSPVEFDVSGGETLTFSASGSTSVDQVCFAGPDGGCYPDESSFGVGPVNGIGTYKGPSDALIGVFLNGSLPSGTGGPASEDFTGANNFTSLSPLLNQIFFIGDGLTGTGSGTVQDFSVPAGATRLFLAVADSVGSSQNNEGSLSVTVSALSSVPEPSTGGMAALAGMAGLAAVLKRRFGRTNSNRLN
jgi:hypothetical protein